ncbi:MAG: hypothetical protein H8E17_13890 [Deltaproteobacteria bacterium]|nr:hypothetical protein [Deltaproteobacteria bacterium]
MDFNPGEMIGNNLVIFIPVLLVLLGLIILYFVLLIRAIIQMLRYNVSSVLLVFSFISLIPFPLILILGIMILIIWHYHKKDILNKKVPDLEVYGRTD